MESINNEDVLNICEQSIQGITEAMEQDQDFIQDNEHSDEFYKYIENSYIARNAQIEAYLGIIGAIRGNYRRLDAFKPLILTKKFTMNF